MTDKFDWLNTLVLLNKEARGGTVAQEDAVQIHELGNSVNDYLGFKHWDENRNGDPDAGETFETCMREELKTKRKS